MTQEDNFLQSFPQWPLDPMQIRKHTASCGALPHTSKLSLEQVMCQEPFGKRTEKGMGIPVQPGAIAFSNSRSWARCQQHRIPLASFWQSSIVLRQQLCCSLFPSRGYSTNRARSPFTQPILYRDTQQAESLLLKVVQYCDALPADNEVEQRTWAKILSA